MVPNIDGCDVKRCVPDPASAFWCTTDTDCWNPDSSGDVCGENGLCVACNTDPSWAEGSCDYEIGRDMWDWCGYSQHLLPGYPCPSGGRAWNGRSTLQDGQIGADGLTTFDLIAGCTDGEANNNTYCVTGGKRQERPGWCSRMDTNGAVHTQPCPPDAVKNPHPNSWTQTQWAALVAASTDPDIRSGAKHLWTYSNADNPCGFDCADGSPKQVQCGYDQPCYRVTADQEEITMNAAGTLSGGRLSPNFPANNGYTLKLTPTARAKLVRSKTCGGQDDSGMRCAGHIHRVVTSEYRTPVPLRDRSADIVQLQLATSWPHQTVADTGWQVADVGSFRADSLATDELTPLSGPIHDHDGNLFTGYVVPSGSIVGSATEIISTAVVSKTAPDAWIGGVHATPAYACGVKWSATEMLHPSWRCPTSCANGRAGASNPTRATLLVRACNIGYGASYCGEWGLSSTHGKVTCSVYGPNVRAPIPDALQLQSLYDSLNTVTHKPALLRLAFHDAGTYSANPASIRGGPNGCIRFREIQGANANAGLGGVESDVISKTSYTHSKADIYQFAGVVAVAAMNGPDLRGQFRWGRVDAPWLLCQGEIAQAMPDHSGGQNAGYHKHGAAAVQERLEETHASNKAYFEGALGMVPEQWVALLGAHTVGQVMGIGSNKAQPFAFDTTMFEFDTVYYRSLQAFAKSGGTSMCPGMNKPGVSHWFDRDNAGALTVMLDTDVSMTVEEPYLSIIYEYAASKSAFFYQFGLAFLTTTELGYGPAGLVAAPGYVAPVTLVGIGETLSSLVMDGTCAHWRGAESGNMVAMDPCLDAGSADTPEAKKYQWYFDASCSTADASLGCIKSRAKHGSHPICLTSQSTVAVAYELMGRSLVGSKCTGDASQLFQMSDAGAITHSIGSETWCADYWKTVCEDLNLADGCDEPPRLILWPVCNAHTNQQFELSPAAPRDPAQPPLPPPVVTAVDPMLTATVLQLQTTIDGNGALLAEQAHFDECQRLSLSRRRLQLSPKAVFNPSVQQVTSAKRHSRRTDSTLDACVCLAHWDYSTYSYYYDEGEEGDEGTACQGPCCGQEGCPAESCDGGRSWCFTDGAPCREDPLDRGETNGYFECGPEISYGSYGSYESLYAEETQGPLAPCVCLSSWMDDDPEAPPACQQQQEGCPAEACDDERSPWCFTDGAACLEDPEEEGYFTCGPPSPLKPCECATSWSDDTPEYEGACLGPFNSCPAQACDGDESGPWCHTNGKACIEDPAGDGYFYCGCDPDAPGDSGVNFGARVAGLSFGEGSVSGSEAWGIVSTVIGVLILAAIAYVAVTTNRIMRSVNGGGFAAVQTLVQPSKTLIGSRAEGKNPLGGL